MPFFFSQVSSKRDVMIIEIKGFVIKCHTRRDVNCSILFLFRLKFRFFFSLCGSVQNEESCFC